MGLMCAGAAQGTDTARRDLARLAPEPSPRRGGRHVDLAPHRPRQVRLIRETDPHRERGQAVAAAGQPVERGLGVVTTTTAATVGQLVERGPHAQRPPIGAHRRSGDTTERARQVPRRPSGQSGQIVEAERRVGVEGGADLVDRPASGGARRLGPRRRQERINQRRSKVEDVDPRSVPGRSSIPGSSGATGIPGSSGAAGSSGATGVTGGRASLHGRHAVAHE